MDDHKLSGQFSFIILYVITVFSLQSCGGGSDKPNIGSTSASNEATISATRGGTIASNDG